MLFIPFFVFVALLCLLGTPGIPFDGSGLLAVPFALLWVLKALFVILPCFAVMALPVCFYARRVKAAALGRYVLWLLLTVSALMAATVLTVFAAIGGSKPWFGCFLLVILAYTVLSSLILKPE